MQPDIKQYKVVLANGGIVLVDHFWIAFVDGRPMVAGQPVTLA
jgi:hypothetical protein